MKLEKYDTRVLAAFVDDPKGTETYTTQFEVDTGIVKDRLRISVRGKQDWVCADFSKGKVEQLIYVLTLARNRM